MVSLISIDTEPSNFAEPLGVGEIRPNEFPEWVLVQPGKAKEHHRVIVVVNDRDGAFAVDKRAARTRHRLAGCRALGDAAEDHGAMAVAPST